MGQPVDKDMFETNEFRRQDIVPEIDEFSARITRIDGIGDTHGGFLPSHRSVAGYVPGNARNDRLL